ncbi:hypothetical protein HMI54_011119 [Coelomomyces lativittatus]|nr:hypothetical protein HMI54_011119 [Coelomomyces lativittatus]
MTETRRPGPNGLFLKLFDASEDHGYKIIAERLRAGKHTLKQLIEVFSLRAAMEEDFSRKLSKVAKTLQEKEFGTLLDAIQAFCTHTENMARKHLEFANLIRSSMEQPSLELLAKQKLIREQYLTAAEKNIKHRASTYQQQLRAQAKYALKCHELNTLRDAKETKYGKEHDKLMNKYTKADNSAKILEIELKQAETQSKQSQITWESEWRDSLNIFEELEIERTQLIALKLVTLSNGSKIMAELEKEVKI